MTSHATVSIDDDGKKFWEIHDGDDPVELDPGQPIEFSPDAFEDGAEVQIWENVDV